MDGDASSVGDAATLASGRSEPEIHKGQKDLLEDNQNLQSAVFGVVYTLSKEKYDASFRFSVAKIVLDFLQLLVLVVRPNYGWHLGRINWMWSILGRFDVTTPILTRGYKTYLIILYLVIFALVGSCTLCVWVGWCFKNDHFPYIWPIKMLRFVVSIFFVVFYVSSLSVLLLALQCNPFDKNPALRWKMVYFYKECLEPPHLIHAAVALVMALLFIFVTAVMAVADFELNPVSRCLLASPTSIVELRAMVMKTLMLISSTLLNNYPKFQAVMVAVEAWLLTYSVLVELPYYNNWVNHGRGALYGCLSWSALLLLVEIYTKKKHSEILTQVLLAGMLPSIVVTFAFSYIRVQWFYKRGLKAFREAEPSARPKDIFKFRNEHEVELLSRCCRVWVDDEVLDQDAIKIADTIIKAGMAMFSNSAALTILYSNFLIEVQNNYQSGHSMLQAAKKLNPNISQRFSIFIREQEHRQKALSSSSGESTVDLVSYVEFQRNYRQLIRSHKGAMYATRNFWKQLLHQNVSFVALTKAFANIDQNQSRAEKTYRMVLERYPSSAKLLRSYAKFLEFVKNDPWSASKYYSEAEKLEEEADTVKKDVVLNHSDALKGENGTVLSQVDDKNNAVFLCTAAGTIQMVNKVAHKMWGYKKGELEGKNVSIIMPAPFSQMHNSYLRNYQTTGEPRILDTVRQVVALHKDRYVFPVKIAVTKVSGAGADAVFMGVLTAVEDDPTIARCWCTINTNIICIDRRFTDWFGKGLTDVVGKPASSLIVEMDRFAVFMKAASELATSTDEEAAGKKMDIPGISVLHKFIDPVKADVSCSIGGTEMQRLLVLEIKRHDIKQQENLLVTDHRGDIFFVTSGAAALLGYSARDIIRKINLCSLMDTPFCMLHAKWIKDPPTHVPPTSCRNSNVVMAKTSNGSSVPVRLNISSRDDGEENIYIMSITKSTLDTGMDLQRLRMWVNDYGTIEKVSKTPSTLFGFNPASLIGQSVSQIIDALHDLCNKDGIDLRLLMSAMISRISEKPGYCWRVSLHPPPDDTSLDSLTSASKSALAASMLKQQTKAAILQMELLEKDDDVHIVFNLFRSDAITGVIEVDKDGIICKAGMSLLYPPGPIFGLESAQMARNPVSRFIDTKGKPFADVFLSTPPQKSVMKSGAAGGSSTIGAVKRLHGFHVDGQPLNLRVQACYKDTSARRAVLKINIVQPMKGSATVFKRTVIADVIAAAEAQSTDGFSDATNSLPLPPVPDEGRQKAYLPSEADTSSPGLTLTTRGPVKFMIGGESKLTKVDSLEERCTLNPLAIEDVDSTKTDAFLMEPPAILLGGSLTPNPADSISFATDRVSAMSQKQCYSSAQSTVSDRQSVSKVREWMTFLQADDVIQETPPFMGVPDGPSSPLLVDPDEPASVISGESQSFKSGSDGDGSPTLQTDFRKGKRFRKLEKLIGGKKTQAAVHRFHTHTYWVLIGLLIVHLACFSTFITVLNSLHKNVYDSDSAGIATDIMHRISLRSVLLREISKGREAPGIYVMADKDGITRQLLDDIRDFERRHENIYLGTGKLRRLRDGGGENLKSLWENHELEVQVLSDIHPIKYETVNMSLWRLGRKFAASAREIMSLQSRIGPNQYSSAPRSSSSVLANSSSALGGSMNDSSLEDLRYNPDWYFVSQNGPQILYRAYKRCMDSLVIHSMDQIQAVNRISMVLLVLEGCIISAVAIAHMWILMRQVSSMRYALFSIFLIIPTGFLRALATKQVHVDDEDGDDSDSDEGDVGIEHTSAKPQKEANTKELVGPESKRIFGSFLSHRRLAESPGNLGNSRSISEPWSYQKAVKRLGEWYDWAVGNSGNQGIMTNKRTLVRNARDIHMVTYPFVMWSVLIIIIYSVSYVRLSKSLNPLVDSNLADRLLFRLMRSVFYTIAFTTSDEPGEKARFRKELSLGADMLERTYNALMYGSQPFEDSIWKASGTTFEHPINAKYFFRMKDKCIRMNKSSCFPQNHKYYQISHMGIDNMIDKLIDDSRLLSREPDEYVNVSNTRLEYIWQVGNYDLHDGVQTAVQRYSDDILSSFNNISSLHVVLFVISWVMALLFIAFIFRPFLRRIAAESRRVAELLSQLPSEMDVDALVEQALGKANSGPGADGDAEATMTASRRDSTAAREPSNRQQPYKSILDTHNTVKSARQSIGVNQSFTLPAARPDAVYIEADDINPLYVKSKR